MRRYGSPVRCGFWHGMSRYGTPEVVRYVSLCFAMFRSLLRLGPPALSRRRRSSRLRDVALCRALSRAGDLRRSRPHFQWNGCRVCCVAFALFPLPGAFFCRFGPVSSCLLWNTRRLGLRYGSRCPGACHGIRPGASGAPWRGCCPRCIVPLSHRKVWGLPIALPGGAAVVTSRTSGIRRSGAGCQVTGRTGAITRAGEGPSRGDIMPAVRSCHQIHLSRQG